MPLRLTTEKCLGRRGCAVENSRGRRGCDRCPGRKIGISGEGRAVAGEEGGSGRENKGGAARVVSPVGWEWEQRDHEIGGSLGSRGGDEVEDWKQLLIFISSVKWDWASIVPAH
jgi:hypothetical protein